MQNEKAVVVKDLEKRFGNFVAVDKISFEVNKGTVFGFLGPNGAGKSTTIRMLCGILAPTGGGGHVGGFDIGTEAEKIKSHIGYMSQKFSLYDDLTVEENLDFYSGIYRVPYALKAERKEWVVKATDLRERLGVRTKLLPPGIKQRLALGCAILHKPSILFLDEPTAGVDVINRRRFWQFIYGLAESGITVFVTTHYMDEAEYFDKIAFIYRGQLIAMGTPDELRTEMMRHAVLDIHCEDALKTMQLLEVIPGVKDIALFGSGLHVVVEDEEVAQKQIRKLLIENGVVIDKMVRIEPFLEDVFVYLIESFDALHLPQQEVKR